MLASPPPLLSIIIPLYNAAPYLEMAVASIFGQNLSTLGGATEIILVNDGSTDGSGEIARRLAAHHPEIVVVEQENRGVSSALNAGIRRARGEFVGILDADDEYTEGALAFLLDELKQLRQQFGDLVMVRGQLRYLRRAPLGASSNPANSSEKDADETSRRWNNWHMDGAPIALSGATASLQTRAVIDEVGFFDEELGATEDTYWLLRAGAKGIVMPLRERVVMAYRQHETNISGDAAFMKNEKMKMLRKLALQVHAQRNSAKERESAKENARNVEGCS